MVMNETSDFGLASRLRHGDAALGEVFAFISGLYFRGKLAYSTAFAVPPRGTPGVLVITAGRGLLSPETRIHSSELREIATVPIDPANPRYREPLEQDARKLHGEMTPDCEVVLLGSIATAKYVEPLLEIFGSRLLIPSEFIGRGDMSRGGLMLRCAQEGVELDYIPAAIPLRRGVRPPKLPKLARFKPG